MQKPFNYCPRCQYEVGRDGKRSGNLKQVSPKHCLYKWCLDCLETKTRELNQPYVR